MDYEEAKIKAAREYAEGLFNPEDVANPEFSDSINCCAADFMEGAEWRRYHRKASDENVEQASKEYALQQVENPDDNPDGVEDTAMGFHEGVEWYDQYTSPNIQSDRFWINILIGVFIAIVLFIFFIAMC